MMLKLFKCFKSLKLDYTYISEGYRERYEEMKLRKGTL